MTANARRLEAAVRSSLTLSGVPTEADILDLATRLRAIPQYSVADGEFEFLVRHLKESLRIDMGLGAHIVAEHVPWLNARKASISPYFWERYCLFLSQNRRAPRVITSLDRVTDSILDLLGDPNSTSGWPRRGLVMGDVQSGKTSTYTGLICKAADADYKLIVLLTGTLESLRRQTQGRLDQGFVGLDSAGMVTRARQQRAVGVGLIDATRAAGVFTSTVADFRAATVDALGFRLKDLREPVLLVVKKNKRILENLTRWLVTFNANQLGTIESPMLLIDDEADHASVNTSPQDATAINAAIRQLLRIFPRSSYVGFTATPFANAFINPDSDDEMRGDDLFPRDFVFALEAPTNYLGPSALFGDETMTSALKPLTDAEEAFPAKHKSDLVVQGLPASLRTAVRTFFLASTLMDLRATEIQHRSMLVNVTHLTAVQNQVRDALDQYVKRLQLDLRSYSKLPPSEAEVASGISALKGTWLAEFGGSGPEWPEVLSHLNDSCQPIQVRAVNQQSGAAALDYSEYEDTGLRVIAVGGNSLSRGLTLEGLVVSYFLRRTRMYDTLLQMGRWFGYRDGYGDLCRIWLHPDTVSWYGHITEASEELRAEIVRMQNARLRPIDFGLKVRAHPESLLITARNKMRHSRAVTRAISVSGELIETPRLFMGSGQVEANFQTSARLIERIDRICTREKQQSRTLLWREVHHDDVAEFVSAFVGHPLNVAFSSGDLARFIREATDPRLLTWDVVVPQGNGKRIDVTANVNVQLQERQLSVDEDTQSVLVSGRKMRVGSRGVEREGLTDEQAARAEANFRGNAENDGKKNVPDKSYRAERERPLLMVHFLEPTVGEGKQLPLMVRENQALCALGLSFPELGAGSRMVTYQVNLVELRNMLGGDEAVAEDDDDEPDIPEET